VRKSGLAFTCTVGAGIMKKERGKDPTKNENGKHKSDHGIRSGRRVFGNAFFMCGGERTVLAWDWHKVCGGGKEN